MGKNVILSVPNWTKNSIPNKNKNVKEKKINKLRIIFQKVFQG